MAKYCMLKNGPALYLECQECEYKNLCDDTISDQVFHCLIVGSRSFTDYAFLKKTMDHLLKNHVDIEIVSGGANGTDQLAERYAKEKGYDFKLFPADWNIGDRAGYERNRKMHKYIANFEKRGCVAFWDGESKGTTHSFSLAKEFDNPLKIIKVNT